MVYAEFKLNRWNETITYKIPPYIVDNIVG